MLELNKWNVRSANNDCLEISQANKATFFSWRIIKQGPSVYTLLHSLEKFLFRRLFHQLCVGEMICSGTESEEQVIKH